IEDCIRAHPTCPKQGNPEWFPTRVIDVGDSSKAPRLLVERNAHLGEAYVSLSHCWGAAKITTLTTALLKSFQDCLPLHILPATFQEAILITRRLGYKYLWIDSLCICQDSAEDWRSESIVMGEVYRNAVVSIAATASSNSYGGCFRDRNLSGILPCEVQATVDPKTGPETVYIHLSRDVWKTVDKSVLNSRAWVLQERILAPRVLHYGPNQLFWECRKQQSCEAFPDGLQAWNIVASQETSLKSIFEPAMPEFRPFAADISAYSSPMEFRYADWDFLVNTYTRCSLTKPEDKLIAINGLAEVWGTMLDDDYMAGLWKKDLLRQLLWHAELLRERDRSRILIGNVPRAPTWSWASIDGEV
ncbi:HET-domain-containing protein, partial [Glonium stellatum]